MSSWILGSGDVLSAAAEAAKDHSTAPVQRTLTVRMDKLARNDGADACLLRGVHECITVAFSLIASDYSTMNSGLPAISTGFSVTDSNSNRSPARDFCAVVNPFRITMSDSRNGSLHNK